jgi:hypothetical protein
MMTDAIIYSSNTFQIVFLRLPISKPLACEEEARHVETPKEEALYVLCSWQRRGVELGRRGVPTVSSVVQCGNTQQTRVSVG